MPSSEIRRFAVCRHLEITEYAIQTYQITIPANILQVLQSAIQSKRDGLSSRLRDIKLYKSEQFRQLSATLRKRPEFYGTSFSWGDNYISNCADYATGPGSLTTWRQVGTNHHIAVVTNQIASSVVA